MFVVLNKLFVNKNTNCFEFEQNFLIFNKLFVISSHIHNDKNFSKKNSSESIKVFFFVGFEQ